MKLSLRVRQQPLENVAATLGSLGTDVEICDISEVSSVSIVLGFSSLLRCSRVSRE